MDYLKKEVFIISTGQIINGRNAGSQRIMNIAKSLAAGNINVFLCSLTLIKGDLINSVELLPGISYIKSMDEGKNSPLNIIFSLRSINKFIKSRNSEPVIYLYPTTLILNDFIYLFYFKFIKGYKFFCEINELRVAIVFSSSPPKSIIPRLLFYLKSSYDYVRYKLNELQVLFYDGIVVISLNLERYFSRYTKNLIRVPILCDLTKIEKSKPIIHFNNSIFKICYAVYIKCEKEGYDILFEALCQVNLKGSVELYLYGIFPDEEKDLLNHLTTKFELRGKVFYMGNMDPDDLLKEFPKYHLLILPRPLNSRTLYGFSTKLSEYLISGVPALVTDVSDNALYIKDGYNGFITSPGSVSGMAIKIMEIIENYNKNSFKIARNAYQTAREKFDYNLYTHIFINFFFKT